jgi:hypothetical protein
VDRLGVTLMLGASLMYMGVVLIMCATYICI